MSYMFSGCSGLTSIDLSPLDTSKVTNMSYMFYACTGLTSIDLSPLDTSKVTNMSYMFYACTGLTTVKLGNEANSSAKVTSIFNDITTTGTMYYPSEYADSYANIIAAIPSTWTAEAY
jgi:surface protein